VVAVALCVSLAACSGSDDRVIYTTTTVDRSSSTTTPKGAAAPVPVDRYVAGLRRAVEAKDLCALLDTVDLQRPDTSDGSVVTQAYAALRDATRDAAAFVPAEPHGPWDAVVAANRSAASIAERSHGQDEVAIEAAFDTPEFGRAYDQVSGWADLHCG
jgi:hypothetical protein